MKHVLESSVKVLSPEIILMEDHQSQVKMKMTISLDTDMEYNIGLMELIMKDNGNTTRLKVKELSGMPREMSIEVNSKMIWQMDMESTLILTVANIRENSKMMFRKEMVRKNGLMEQNM